MKIKNVYISILFIILSSCSKTFITNVKHVIESRDINNETNIEVRGYIFIEEMNLIKLYSDKNSNIFIDVIIGESIQFDETLKQNKYYCVDISGLFQSYDNDVIVKMNLYSDYGLIIVKKLTRCT